MEQADKVTGVAGITNPSKAPTPNVYDTVMINTPKINISRIPLVTMMAVARMPVQPDKPYCTTRSLA